MNGKANRRKGHEFERKTAQELRDAGYTKSQRVLEYQSGGAVDITGCEPFQIQCKVAKSKLNPKEALEKMLSVVDKKYIAVVRAKENRGIDMAVMTWKDFLFLAEVLRSNKII